MSKLYTNELFLYNEYVKKKKTAKEIAELCGVSEVTIWNWLRKFDMLKYRGKGRKLR